MSKGVVLSLCDYTGNMVKPWADAGYKCWCVDVQHPAGFTTKSKNIVLVGEDVFDLNPFIQPDIIFAFPPCTDLAVSGALHFKSKGMKKLIAALELVECCREICEDKHSVPFFIENPVSTLSTYWRKPDYIFNPCDYGGYEGGEDDAYTKKTCLWTGGGFVMPDPDPIEPVQGSKMHKLPPSEERANLRSETPKGFAQAVFEANHPMIQEKKYVKSKAA